MKKFMMAKFKWLWLGFSLGIAGFSILDWEFYLVLVPMLLLDYSTERGRAWNERT